MGFQPDESACSCAGRGFCGLGLFLLDISYSFLFSLLEKNVERQEKRFLWSPFKSPPGTGKLSGSPRDGSPSPLSARNTIGP